MAENGPRALVLSAGGMFGAYQAGVWQELADSFDPEIVVGASVGSLNGWYIACRRDPQELVDRWLGLDGLTTVRWRFPRRLTDGILDNSMLESEIRRMCGHGAPVRRFGIVMTHMRTLTPKVVEWPEANWTHIAASCGVPLFLRNYQIGGEWYSDGGVVDPLPVSAAMAMGARTIVAVNLLKHRPWPVRAGVRFLRRWSGYVPFSGEDITLLEICADSPLGAVRDSIFWSRDAAARLIERGRQDARRVKPAIVQWSEREIAELGNVPYPSSA